jgi:thiol-disulfide isomerase/thioredoxin
LNSTSHPELRLYHTGGCHLCEQAESMLFGLQKKYQFIVIKVDIINHESDLIRYRDLIPVIVYKDQELHWPFSYLDLDRLLSLSKLG